MFTILALFATPIAILVHSKKKLGKMSWGWAVISFVGSMMALSQQPRSGAPIDTAEDLGTAVAIFVLWFGVYLIGARKKLRHQPHAKNSASVTHQRKINNIQLREYLDRLRNVYREHGSFLDEGPGEAAAKDIGFELVESFGSAGMVKVCETYRDTIDRIQARAIEKAWDGIGGWRG